MYVKQGESVVSTKLPSEQKLDWNQGYDVMPVTWVPSMALKRQDRNFRNNETYEYELQDAIDRIALERAGIDASGLNERGSCLSRFGGWPVNSRDDDIQEEANNHCGPSANGDDWIQLLSLDSHMEIGMCFWDAGKYEFVVQNSSNEILDFTTPVFKSYQGLYGFG